MRLQVTAIAAKNWFPRAWPSVLIIVILAAGWLIASCGGTQSTQERCNSISMVSGQPQVVAVMVDGIDSSAIEKGSFYPVPVSHPDNHPMVTNYCPVAPDGQKRDKNNGWPAGLELGLGKWSSFGVPDAPDESIGTACEASTLSQNKNSCLIARLADAGAVILPYSYTGATLSSTPAGPLFNISAYTKDNSKQAPYDSVKQLDNELYSIHTVWQQARIIIVAHSNGGMIAEMWWECLFGGNCPMSLNHQPFNDHRGVAHVFSLDSPINGVKHYRLAAVIRTASAAVADQWGLLWNDLNNEQKHDRAIINIDTDGSFTPVGTRNDPTYSNIPLFGYNGGINSQVVYSCWMVSNACMAQPPSYVSPCDAKKPIFGTTGHFTVRACPQVVKFITCSVVAARDNGNQQACYPGAVSPNTPTLTASISPTELPINVDCTSTSQLCNPPFETTVKTGSVLKIEYIVTRNCSSIRLHVFVDGKEVTTTVFLGWVGGPSPLSTGILDLGPVVAGQHVLGLQAEGQVGGCNSGQLISWDGTVRIYT